MELAEAYGTKINNYILPIPVIMDLPDTCATICNSILLADVLHYIKLLMNFRRC